jgi:hypothetical protein
MHNDGTATIDVPRTCMACIEKRTETTPILLARDPDRHGFLFMTRVRKRSVIQAERNQKRGCAFDAIIE